MLLGNGFQQGVNPLRHVGQTNQAERGNWGISGSLRNSATGAVISGETKKASIPSGLTHPSAWFLAQNAGALSSRYNVTGDASVTGSGALGRNLASGFTASGNLDGTAQLVVSGAADITASTDFDGSIVAALIGSADITSSAAFTGDVDALGFFAAAITSSATVAVTSYARGFMAADIAPPITLEAEAFSEQLLDQEDVETGMTVRQALRLISAATGGKVSGGGTSTITFRSAIADDTDRIVATVDGSGNRTAVTVDLD